jgi:two-component system, LytTR family, sensor kinase
MKKILNNRLLQHILFWCFQIILYFFTYRKNEPVTIGIAVTLAYLPSHLFFTYMQLYVLIPRFLLQKKNLSYLLYSLLICKIAINLSMLITIFIVNPLRHKSVDLQWDLLWKISAIQITSIFALLNICGIAVTIKLLKKWYLQNAVNKNIEKEKNIIELELLKAQVHPHFLFNTLNNLYSLTLTQSDAAPMVVNHLSGLLHYMLYECNEKQVMLDKEIDVLKKYIELEKIRYGNRINISFSCTGETKQLMIAPLLLLPFIENGFKHGLSQQLDECYISIDLQAKDDHLTFTQKNSFTKHKSGTETGGIGQQNIKKRLELIYPGKYSLRIKEEEDIFIVKLYIHLISLHTKSFVANSRVKSKPVTALTV